MREEVKLGKGVESIMKPIVTIRDGIDGTWVVEIDTDPTVDGEPVIRVYLNDATLFENPVFPEE